MSVAKSAIETILREEARNLLKEYFGSFAELEKGPVFQVHAAMTKNGLTKAVRKTKRSQLADMRRRERVFLKAPRGVGVNVWESRWCSTRTQMQKKTGYKWSINRDHERSGVWITRVL